MSVALTAKPRSPQLEMASRRRGGNGFHAPLFIDDAGDQYVNDAELLLAFLLTPQRCAPAAP